MKAMPKLTQKDRKEINHLRSLFPAEITVNANYSQDDGFYADILTYPGCHTQGETFSELIDMINDCMYTYFDVPEKYLSSMFSYMPPIEMGKKLGILPNLDELKLKIVEPQREKVKC